MTQELVNRAESTPDLDSAELYTNRELSWLDFNERVLELAEDERTPLLERIKFLAIYTTNLDEFIMVRVAGLHGQVDAGIDARKADGLSPSQTIERIGERTRELGKRLARQWEEEVRPALSGEGIRVVASADCSEKELEALDRIFNEQI
ncbi:MAG: RNA degradosome polyphosphate kinase, partial [Thermoleophilaceae bacterium]|nr:RNA degradosome polyphosphate kinase [Thermoleophilaceae bacterium]